MSNSIRTTTQALIGGVMALSFSMPAIAESGFERVAAGLDALREASTLTVTAFPGDKATAEQPPAEYGEWRIELGKDGEYLEAFSKPIRITNEAGESARGPHTYIYHTMPHFRIIGNFTEGVPEIGTSPRAELLCASTQVAGRTLPHQTFLHYSGISMFENPALREDHGWGEGFRIAGEEEFPAIQDLDSSQWVSFVSVGERPRDLRAWKLDEVTNLPMEMIWMRLTAERAEAHRVHLILEENPDDSLDATDPSSVLSIARSIRADWGLTVVSEQVSARPTDWVYVDRSLDIEEAWSSLMDHLNDKLLAAK